MPPADWFRHFGVFVQHGFLSDALCRRLAVEMAAASAPVPALVARAAGDALDGAIRRTLKVEVTPQAEQEVRVRLADLRPALSRAFGVTLGDGEGPVFLSYPAGGFFKPHRDRAAPNEGTEVSRARSISVVAFLNAGSVEGTPGDYAGGDLTLFGLFDTPPLEDLGFTLDAEPGLLVAFRSTVLHAVTPVTAGVRRTMVDWFPESS